MSIPSRAILAELVARARLIPCGRCRAVQGCVVIRGEREMGRKLCRADVFNAESASVSRV